MMLMTMMVVKWISRGLIIDQVEHYRQCDRGHWTLVGWWSTIIGSNIPQCVVYHSQCAAVVPVAPVLGYVIYHKCLLASIHLYPCWQCSGSADYIGRLVFKDDIGGIHPEFCRWNGIIETYPERPEAGLLPRYKYGLCLDVHMNGVVVANITRVEEKNMNNNTVYTVSQSLQRAAYTNTGPNANAENVELSTAEKQKREEDERQIATTRQLHSVINICTVPCKSFTRFPQISLKTDGAGQRLTNWAAMDGWVVVKDIVTVHCSTRVDEQNCVV